jgi:hypothetical protein
MISSGAGGNTRAPFFGQSSQLIFAKNGADRLADKRLYE